MHFVKFLDIEPDLILQTFLRALKYLIGLNKLVCIILVFNIYAQKIEQNILFLAFKEHDMSIQKARDKIIR